MKLVVALGLCLPFLGLAQTPSAVSNTFVGGTPCPFEVIDGGVRGFRRGNENPADD